MYVRRICKYAVMQVLLQRPDICLHGVIHCHFFPKYIRSQPQRLSSHGNKSYMYVRSIYKPNRQLTSSEANICKQQALRPAVISFHDNPSHHLLKTVESQLRVKALLPHPLNLLAHADGPREDCTGYCRDREHSPGGRHSRPSHRCSPPHHAPALA